MISVLIADDEPLIRAGIRTVLESEPDLVVTAEAGDGRAAVEAALACRPDVALIDIRMPVLDGLSAVGEIRRHLPGVRAVMLTSFGTEPNAQGAIRAGAAGFVLKSCAPDELIRAIRAAHAGHAYLSPPVTRIVLDLIPPTDIARGQAAAARLATLSPRESQVMSLLAEGLPNASIASHLRITEASTKTYVSRILAKLGCASRVQAALLARDAWLPGRPGGPAQRLFGPFLIGVTPPALFHGQCGTNQEKPSARAAISAFVKCT
ncbi:MAG: response regulator transcription factor [Streptosporangiaceae bacterium]|jgi:DNA-binding NarL/FixJ family response regulator